MTPPALARISALLAALAALPAAAQADLEKKCLEGHPESCARVARAAVPEQGGKRDLPKAAVYDLRACAAAEPDAPYCRGAGLSVEAARQDPAASKALTAALEAVGKACESGKMTECNTFGMVKMLGTLGSPDVESGKALFTKACDGGVAAACANAADVLAKGPPADRPRAVALYGKACGGTATWACKIAGLGYVQGAAGAKDPVQAARAFKRGCDARDQRSCILLLSLYQQDPAGARETFRKACGNDMRQCADFDALIQGAEAAQRGNRPR